MLTESEPEVIQLGGNRTARGGDIVLLVGPGRCGKSYELNRLAGRSEATRLEERELGALVDAARGALARGARLLLVDNLAIAANTTAQGQSNEGVEALLGELATLLAVHDGVLVGTARTLPSSRRGSSGVRISGSGLSRAATAVYTIQRGRWSAFAEGVAA